jgi:hypothetical protein
MLKQLGSSAPLSFITAFAKISNSYSPGLKDGDRASMDLLKSLVIMVTWGIC